ncbi:MAG TPA: hypothetical protein VMU07_01245 [Candidatus Paceibacterota bacterium]|nr:hypothetical protein [Candidatus Paceibacterota bacterium]
MKRGPLIALIIILVIIAVLAILLVVPGSSGNQTVGTPNGTTTGTGATSTPTSTLTFDQSISDGVITVSYPSADFGLATNASQVLVHPYIPPCSAGFTYCLYYTGGAYSGTTFESAGIRIQKRTDLATQNQCLTTEPAGFGLRPVIVTSTDYAASVFSPLGDAAAGHFANGAVYRLSYGKNCYEFETRIGESDYGNYPSGSIQQFTPDEQTAIQNELQHILGTLVVVSSGESVHFPPPPQHLPVD